MTPEIALVLTILVIAVILFVSEKLRVDVVAMLVLVTLGLTGLISAEQAVSSFNNPAVITVGAVFVLSAGLSRTGVAGILGTHVLKLAHGSELLLVSLIMLTAAFMSAFMNNVGVAALLLPVIMDIARRTGRSPSKLLIPLAFSSLLGGLTTLIGTPPNILVSAGLEEPRASNPSVSSTSPRWVCRWCWPESSTWRLSVASFCPIEVSLERPRRVVRSTCHRSIS